MTLTPIVERLALELLLPVYTTKFVAAGFRTPDLPIRGEWSYRLQHRRDTLRDKPLLVACLETLTEKVR